MNISVVIPAYNEEEIIGDCIDNIEAQMIPGDEIIVVDNGSTDRTGEIARSKAVATVIYKPDSELDTDDPRPIGHLRQIGTQEASNPIVASTDADTIPESNWLKKIRSHFDNDEDLVCVWGIATDKNGVPVRNLTGKYLTFFGGVSGCNTAFRKSVFSQMKKGYIGWPIFEDVALITRMSRMGKTVHDTNLIVKTDLTRDRYQTIPIVAASAAGAIAGLKIGGKFGGALFWGSSALGTTELVYENFTDHGLNLHHDEVGVLVAASSVLVSEKRKELVFGTGAGLFLHHFLTEGASMAPTELTEGTDVFI